MYVCVCVCALALVHLDFLMFPCVYRVFRLAISTNPNSNPNPNPNPNRVFILFDWSPVNDVNDVSGSEVERVVICFHIVTLVSPNLPWRHLVVRREGGREGGDEEERRGDSNKMLLDKIHEL